MDNFLLDLVIVSESYKMRGKEEVQCMTNELVLKSNIKLEGLEEALNIGDYKLGRWNVDTVKQEREHRKDVLLTGFVAQICFVKQKPILHPSRFLVEKDTSQKPQEPNFTSRAQWAWSSAAHQEWLFPFSGVVGLVALCTLGPLCPPDL